MEQIQMIYGSCIRAISGDVDMDIKELMRQKEDIVALGGTALEECLYSEQFHSYKEQCSTLDISAGIKAAQKAFENFITDNKNAELRLCVNMLPDTVKMPVLLNSWRYLTDNFMIQETFRQFMKKYNEGVM